MYMNDYGCNDDKLIIVDELYVELCERYNEDFANEIIDNISHEHLFGYYGYLDDVAFESIEQLIPNYFE